MRSDPKGSWAVGIGGKGGACVLVRACHSQIGCSGEENGTLEKDR